MEDYTTWLVIGAIGVGAGAIPIGYGVVHLYERYERYSRPSNGIDAVRIACASISSDLIPLIDGLPKADVPFQGSKLCLFGNDGRYFVKKNGKRWRKKLIQWGNKGLEIEYILLDADTAVREEMRNLKEQLGDKFEAILADDSLSGYLEENGLLTFHPTLFFGPNEQKAAWLEGRHEKDSEFAYNVLYLSPNAVLNRQEFNARFDECDSMIRRVREECTSITLNHLAA